MSPSARLHDGEELSVPLMSTCLEGSIVVTPLSSSDEGLSLGAGGASPTPAPCHDASRPVTRWDILFTDCFSPCLPALSDGRDRIWACNCLAGRKGSEREKDETGDIQE